MIWGSFNGLEQLISLIIQEVQNESAVEAGLKFLPEPVVGVVISGLTGFAINRYSPYAILLTAQVVACISPAVIGSSNIDIQYWRIEFPSLCLLPIGADTLFIIATIMVTHLFPRSQQGLAGSIINIVAQIGRSAGIALVGFVASHISQEAQHITPRRSDLMKGYKAASLVCLGGNIISLIVLAIALRRVKRLST